MKTVNSHPMYELEDIYYCYAGERGIFLSVLDDHYQASKGLAILDAGCGTGTNLDHPGLDGRTSGWHGHAEEH